MQGVLDKFSQIQPSLMFSVDAVIYNGKLHSNLDKLRQVVEGEFTALSVISSNSLLNLTELVISSMFQFLSETFVRQGSLTETETSR